MLRTPEELRAALSGTPLGERDIQGVVVPDLEELEVAHPERDAVFAVSIDASDLMETWTIARDLVPLTGRWPVAVVDWSVHSRPATGLDWVTDALTRFYFREELVGSTDPRAVIGRTAGIDVDAELDRIGDQKATPFLLRPEPHQVGIDARYLEWFDPDDLPIALLFIPDAVPEHSLAYVHWYAGSSITPTHLLIALFARWRAAYGAEIVANWRTMLQLVARRPPKSWEQALRLAWEQEFIAECTTILPGVSVEEHAKTLMSVDRWFLHERP